MAILNTTHASTSLRKAQKATPLRLSTLDSGGQKNPLLPPHFQAYYQLPRIPKVLHVQNLLASMKQLSRHQPERSQSTCWCAYSYLLLGEGKDSSSRFLNTKIKLLLRWSQLWKSIICETFVLGFIVFAISLSFAAFFISNLALTWACLEAAKFSRYCSWPKTSVQLLCRYAGDWIVCLHDGGFQWRVLYWIFSLFDGLTRPSYSAWKNGARHSDLCIRHVAMNLKISFWMFYGICIIFVIFLHV